MVTLVVDDYDEAISYFVNDLGFELIEDTVIDSEKRWVVISPGEFGARILLAKAASEQQKKSIGKSTGGRVAFFIYTDNFQSTYDRFQSKKVEFTEEPRFEDFGRVVVFKDLYGNKWDLIETKDNG